MQKNPEKEASLSLHGDNEHLELRTSFQDAMASDDPNAPLRSAHTHHDHTHHDHTHHDKHRRNKEERQQEAMRHQLALEEELKEKEKEKKKGTFVDAAAMKEKVRQSLSKPKHSVNDYYWDTGWCQAVAKSQIFDKMTLTVIALNALWIAVDTDWNDSAILLTADPVFIVAENFFCIFFTFEWIVRFGAFQKKRNGLKDGWFVFDSFMVFMMVAETWVFTIVLAFIMDPTDDGAASSSGSGVMSLARLLRLSRMARMGKLLRVMPELMIMLKGMKAATRSVGFTLLLLAIITYVYGIAFTQLATGKPDIERYFSWVPESMYTLLIFGIFLDNVGVLAEPLRADFHLALLFFTFVLIGSLTVMNMLVGVLCEVVSAVASTEQETMLVTYVQEKLTRVMAILDVDGGGTINKHEFVQILDNQEAVRCLSDVGVDVFALIDLADYIFEEDSPSDVEVELDFGRFMDVVLQLRGSNQATVKDVVDLRKFMRMTMQENYKQTQSIIERIDGLARSMPGPSINAYESSLEMDLKLGSSPMVMSAAPNGISLPADRPSLIGKWAPVGDEMFDFRIPLQSEAAGLTSEKDGLLWRKQLQPADPPMALGGTYKASGGKGRGTAAVDAATRAMRTNPKMRMESFLEEAEMEALQRQIGELCRQLAVGMNDSIAMLGQSLEKRARVGDSLQAKAHGGKRV